MAGQIRGSATGVLLDGGAGRGERPGLVLAQGGTERKIDPLALPLDKPDVWTLHFRYKPPRIIEVDALDKDGKKVKKTVWYMWYQVYNLSGEPQTCLPEFELVTKDLNTTHLDEPQPFIFEQIKSEEDRTITPEKPNGYLRFPDHDRHLEAADPGEQARRDPARRLGPGDLDRHGREGAEDEQVHDLRDGPVERAGGRGDGDRARS